MPDPGIKDEKNSRYSLKKNDGEGNGAENARLVIKYNIFFFLRIAIH